MILSVAEEMERRRHPARNGMDPETSASRASNQGTKKPGIHHQERLRVTDARNCPGTVPQRFPSCAESKAEDFSLLKKILSIDRFESYRANANDSDELIFERYQWNASICECFYVPLRILEVVLRNSFNEAIAAQSRDVNWLTKSPSWLQPHSRDSVVEAHQFLAKRRRPLTQARVVQEMSFGFWTSLLNSRHETLFHRIGAQVFPGLPKRQRTRAQASAKFEEIRALRNRIFHFRRIWNRPDLNQDFEGIVEAMNWVNCETERLLLPPDARRRFQAVLINRPR